MSPCGTSACSVTPQHERDLLTHEPAIAVHEDRLGLLELAVARATCHLQVGLSHVRHAAGHSRLPEAELAAVRVHRKVALVRHVVFVHELAALALAAEAS